MIINVLLIQRRLFIDVTSCFYESKHGLREIQSNQSLFLFIYFSLKVKEKKTNISTNINASMMVAELLLLILFD